MNQKEKEREKGKKIVSGILYFLFVVLCAVAAYFLATYLFTTIQVEGSSMEATLHTGDRVLLLKPVSRYRYGDVVVFDSGQRNESGQDRYFVKRIIGMPGDTVEIIYDQVQEKYFVWRNGVKLQEDYCSSPMYSELPRTVIPEGQFFYLGDNREHSSDSRVYGCGNLDSILGRVILRYSGTLKNLDIDFIKRLETEGLFFNKAWMPI